MFHGNTHPWLHVSDVNAENAENLQQTYGAFEEAVSKRLTYSKQWAYRENTISNGPSASSEPKGRRSLVTP